MDKYNNKKRRNQAVSELAVNHVSPRMGDLVKNCASWIQFLENKERDIKKWLYANSCDWRFCPMCTMRKSYRDALRISVVMDWISQVYAKDFIFLTLTVPNVKGDLLVDTISRMGKAWKRLLDRRHIESINHGFIRKLETTYDKEPFITQDMWDGTGRHNGRPRAAYFTRRGLLVDDENPNFDTYHPHFHAVLAVNKSYFKSRDYVSQEKWLKLWRESVRDETITQVDVRRIKRRADAASLAGGFDVNEFAKYAAKDEDYAVNEHVFSVFYKALKGRQHQTYNGLFAEGNRKYKAGELEHYIKPDLTEYMYETFFRWGNESTGYEEKKIRRLDPQADWDLVNRGINIASSGGVL
jgi:plasmid rolling circle replication initiator protein Rep